VLERSPTQAPTSIDRLMDCLMDCMQRPTLKGCVHSARSVKPSSRMTVLAVLVMGSVARNEHVQGKSDIDMVGVPFCMIRN